MHGRKKRGPSTVWAHRCHRERESRRNHSGSEQRSGEPLGTETAVGPVAVAVAVPVAVPVAVAVAVAPQRTT
eukprot:COSAG01_NODE_8498_length_2763_cov_1.614489_3_plen_71_part_01